MDWERVMNMALIGGVIGAGIGLVVAVFYGIAALFRRKK